MGRVCGPVLVALCAAAFVAVTSVPADAQAWRPAGGDAPRKGSWEGSVGVGWTAGFDLDTEDAVLTGNDGNSSTPFPLFSASARVRPVISAQGRVGFYLSSSLAFEAGVQYSRPVLAVSASDDAEDAEDVTAEERMSRYVIDGSLVYHLRSLAFSRGRGLPFIAAGAGYLRELHEGDELVETGTTYHAGGGIKFWLSQGRRRIGIRGDAGVTIRDGSFDFEDKRRVLPGAGASMIFLF